MGALEKGIYDDLVTLSLQAEAATLPKESLQAIYQRLEEAEIPEYLTRFLAGRLRSSLKQLQDPLRCFELANSLLTKAAEAHTDLTYLTQDLLALADEQQLLAEIIEPGSPQATRPTSPLGTSNLYTGAAGLPQLGNELKAELATASRCDMLVAFIKMAGIRLLLPALEDFLERGGKLRVVTTSYMGASDPVAVERLTTLPGVETRVSYDTKISRLHAKAYIMHRHAGLSSAYVGSANLSHSAMTSGLEWTVKISERDLPHLFHRCSAEFEQHWENPEFEPYDPMEPLKLRQAIKRERGITKESGTLPVLFDLRPYEFQQEVLDQLARVRATQKHTRNLVVAATGTGKTMMAAFDYQRFSNSTTTRPTMLFVAHRKEILEQARQSFRGVLRDHNFGDLLFSGQAPSSFDYLFCSVASFRAKKLWQKFPATHWRYVVVDETHHGEAVSYKELLTQLKPEILLGLTATPERGDGQSIDRHFDYPYAAEIRLPDALDRKLLCPFHYFAVSDNTIDLSGVSWRRGGYDENEIENLLTGNDARAQLVIDALRRYVPDPLNGEDFDRVTTKGLGFCASKSHAAHMSDAFNQVGIPAAALDSDTTSEERSKYRAELENGILSFLFVIDIFNEGVDIPAINCVLFLRPTESHVVFLQQLGRGLRHAKGKDCLTVLDFVAQCHRSFRYDQRFVHLLPRKRHQLPLEVEQDFPHLPPGCAIEMERQAREVIVSNIKRTYRSIDLRVVDALGQWKKHSPPSLLEFTEASEESAVELLERRTWSEWKAKAGLVQKPIVPDLNVSQLALSLARAAHLNASQYIEFILDLCQCPAPELKKLAGSGFALMAHYLIWNQNNKNLGFERLERSFERFRANTSLVDDMVQVCELMKIRANGPTSPVVGAPEILELHGSYSSREINAAFQKASLEKTGPTGTGLIPDHKNQRLIHLVTFEKTEKHFSPTTMYRDYPKSRNLLQWDSQAGCSQQSKIGKLYQNHAKIGFSILFFARILKTAGKVTPPYVFLGSGQFRSWEGDRPIAIEWELDQPMPVGFYRQARLACGLYD